MQGRRNLLGHGDLMKFSFPLLFKLQGVPYGSVPFELIEICPIVFEGDFGILRLCYTAGRFVWCDRPFYLVKWSQEKWACDFHDDATPLSFQLQVTEVNFEIS